MIWYQRTRWFTPRAVLYLAASILFSGCAATRPPDPGTPRAPENEYPIRLNEDIARREAALAAWRNLAPNQPASSLPNPDLLPITSTIQRLPDAPAVTITLPAVGQKPTQSEEEIRESLRRFLTAAGPLLCQDRDQLTLVQRVDNADGTKTAFYEQRPFRYALRGGFGKVRIDFTTDRRLAQVSSTCLPDLDDAQRDIQSLRPDPTVTPDRIAAILKGQTLTPPNGGAAVTVSSADDFTLAEPVILVRETLSSPPALEFRLAWEVNLKAGFPIYIDAIDSSILPAPARS